MDSKLKILMVLEGIFPPDERVEKEAISLMNVGFDIHVACYTFDKHAISNYDYKGIKVHSKFINAFVYKSSIGCLDFPFYFRFWENFIWNLHEIQKFKLIHIHDLRLARLGYKFKRQFKIPFLLDLHENFPALLEASQHIKRFPGKLFYSSKQWRNYERESLINCDYVITVVEEMKTRFTDIGIPESKIFVIPNTPDLNQFRSLSAQPEDSHITFIYTGGITEHRGLQIVINALPVLKKEYPEIRLWIVGSGFYLKKLKLQVIQLELNDIVFFLGYKPHPEVFNLISKSDIALIPHLKSVQTDNSSPNKLYQYLYFNKPIICSNCNSLVRILKEADSGFIYKDDSSEEFRKKVREIIDGDNIKSSGAGGRKLIIEKYNWDKTVTPLLDIYQTLNRRIK